MLCKELRAAYSTKCSERESRATKRERERVCVGGGVGVRGGADILGEAGGVKTTTSTAFTHSFTSQILWVTTSYVNDALVDRFQVATSHPHE